MMEVFEKIDKTVFYQQVNEKGYGLIKEVLNQEQCQTLIGYFENDDLFRKTVVMERHQYGKGHYRYFQHPLPGWMQELRSGIYELLAPLANQWARALKMKVQYPVVYDDFLDQCAAQGQKLATPLVLRYEKGGFNTLHQDLYGEVYFPMQAIFCLSKARVDFEGGELVLTEQTPRAQSRPIAINPAQGDMVVIPTQFRPGKSARGYYRLNMRHGVSEVTQGTRYSMGIILHDALK